MLNMSYMAKAIFIVIKKHVYYFLHYDYNKETLDGLSKIHYQYFSW